MDYELIPFKRLIDPIDDWRDGNVFFKQLKISKLKKKNIWHSCMNGLHQDHLNGKLDWIIMNILNIFESCELI